MSRFARRKDSNHGPVVKAFEFAGASWLNIEGTTPGAPDGVLGCSGSSHLVEIKPNTALKAHRPKPNQVAFAEKWRGSPVHLVRSPQEAWELVGLLRMSARNRAGMVAPVDEVTEAKPTTPGRPQRVKAVP